MYVFPLTSLTSKWHPKTDYMYRKWYLGCQGLINPSYAEATVFRKPSKPCHAGIHWIAFAEYSKMSIHDVPRLKSFF